jgi:hypothetical protein
MRDADLAEALSLPADDAAGQLEPVDTDSVDVARIIRLVVTAGLIIGAAAAVLIIWEAWDENRRIAASTITATSTDGPAAPAEPTADTPPPAVADTGPVPGDPPGPGPADLPATG